MPKVTKKKRINDEKARLSAYFEEVSPEKQGVTAGLIERAAYMRVELEDMEVDLQENGFTELFQQGNQDPYERLRPIANAYNSMNGNYQKIIRQLTALLPHDLNLGGGDGGDGFDNFIRSRQD